MTNIGAQSTAKIKADRLDTRLTFLFWNLDNRNVKATLFRLVQAHNVDVIALAESQHPDTTSGAIVSGLNPAYPAVDYADGGGFCERIRIFTRKPVDGAVALIETDKYTIRRLHLPGYKPVTFVAAHLLSLKEASEQTLTTELELFAADIRRVEDQLAHRRTIVVGDLNQNPFAVGVVSAAGLHGVMSQRIAREETRTVQGRDYPFLYNPMWSRMGERSQPAAMTHSGESDPRWNEPPGTFYYRRADHVCYFWNTFDQVLIRPSLLDFWSDADLHIVTSVDNRSLLAPPKNTPGGRFASDHLPIVFSLTMQGENE